jgi:hypothetical protein
MIVVINVDALILGPFGCALRLYIRRKPLMPEQWLVMAGDVAG